jgi:glycosyltransferase involved in cell wall biosynthesis
MNICILYKVPKNSVKYESWHDGFTKAIDLLKQKYSIVMKNIVDKPKIDFNNYDLVFFKESFEGNIYSFYKNKLKPNQKLGLFISSSTIIPNENQLKIYHILFYETKWYYKYAKLNRHPMTYHAFGVDTQIMKPINLKKKYDVIFVGCICNYKRPLKILNIPGKKVCIGFKKDKILVSTLEKNNVEVIDFVEYEKLANYLNQSKLCYIPCTLHGGGERCVLEARSCNIPIRIENDNTKLKELETSQIYSSYYYADQIE